MNIACAENCCLQHVCVEQTYFKSQQDSVMNISSSSTTGKSVLQMCVNSSHKETISNTDSEVFASSPARSLYSRFTCGLGLALSLGGLFGRLDSRWLSEVDDVWLPWDGALADLVTDSKCWKKIQYYKALSIKMSDLEIYTVVQLLPNLGPAKSDAHIQSQSFSITDLIFKLGTDSNLSRLILKRLDQDS